MELVESLKACEKLWRLTWELVPGYGVGAKQEALSRLGWEGNSEYDCPCCEYDLQFSNRCIDCPLTGQWGLSSDDVCVSETGLYQKFWTVELSYDQSFFALLIAETAGEELKRRYDYA